MAKTTEDLSNGVIQDCCDSIFRAIQKRAADLPFSRAGTSPLEKIVGTSLYSMCFSYNATVMMAGMAPVAVFYPDVGVSYDEMLANDCSIVAIWHQLKIDQYTADFAIRFEAKGGKPVWVAIECDGHDFHERTKEQAAHDRARDRHFQSRGLFVFRYTGSEIWREPLHPVMQVHDFCMKRSLE